MREKSMLKSGFYLFFLILLSMTGCNKFRGDQEVPAYIMIDSIVVNQASANALGFTPTSKITDFWISVDGWKIGCYQLPACIPVLKRGEQKVLIEPGILANNLSLRRTIYPFYSGKELIINLVEDSIVYITRKDTIINSKDTTIIKPIEVAIRASNKYPLSNENFERGKHGFDTVSSYGGVPLEIKRSNTVSEKFPAASTPERLYEEHVGLIHLTKDSSCCCVMTKETCSKGTETELPYNKPIYVEIDYLTNNIFEVGIISTLNNKPNVHPVVVIGSQKNPQWSKVYVDISNAVTAQLYDKADDFRVFIRAYLEEGNEEAYIYLDNIRLVH
jgi:hypothetical protein